MRKPFEVKKTKDGTALLNLGCGYLFHSEWNNIDLFKHEHVHCYDIRRPLPYPNDSFDGVYSSHVLEHFSKKDGKRLVQEMYRVLKPNGTVRVVVPDLEKICTEYIYYLNACKSNASEKNMQRYIWIKLELLDQLVRETCGGDMLETLRGGNVDWDYIKERDGDQFLGFYREVDGEEVGRKYPKILTGIIDFLRKIKRKYTHVDDPRVMGELHRWMYDEFSLKVILLETGFKDIARVGYLGSRIPHWGEYRLDTSVSGGGPRKPDSLFMEGKK